MRTLTVTLVQKASGLDPAENLAALDDVVAEAFSGSSPRPDLVVLPEVFMRDFGKPGSDIGAFAEALDGPFVRRLRQKAEEYDVTLVAGMFERSEDPARPYNTLVVVDRERPAGDVPEDPPLRLLRLQGVRPAARRRPRAGHRRPRRASASG